ncbi:enolase 4 isoform X2 [Mobula birostris]|uniref:enolase 4 isoform X2 n=1 Tax=Mobula birostris TaxID=1983395 RepID=UPI003B289669
MPARGTPGPGPRRSKPHDPAGRPATEGKPTDGADSADFIQATGGLQGTGRRSVREGATACDYCERGSCGMSVSGDRAVEGCGSAEAREFHHLKQRAAEYYRSNAVPQRMQQVLNTMFYEKPDDVYGHLANYFGSFANPAAVSRIIGREILDINSQSTVEVEVLCTIKNFEKSVCFAAMSNCCSDPNYTTQGTGANDNEQKNQSVKFALEWINGPLNSMLKGLLPENQTHVDRLLSDYFRRKVEEDEEQRNKDDEEEKPTEPELPSPIVSAPVGDKKKKSPKDKRSNVPEKTINPRYPPEALFPGSVAIGVVSLAMAKAAARLQKTRLYLYIASLNQAEESPKEMRMPLPLISLLDCGKSSGGKLRLLKEVIAVPQPSLGYKKALKMMRDLQQEISKWMLPPKHGPAVMSHLGCWKKGYDRIEQAFEVIQEACTTLQMTLGEDLHLMLNCGAHELMDYEKQKYEVITGVLKHPDDIIEFYTKLIEQYPSIIGLIDPLRKEDVEQWNKLCSLLSPRCYILADAASRSIDKLLTDGLGVNQCSGLVLKHANQTTISNLIHIAKLLEDNDCRFIPGLTEEDTTDNSLADIAVGLGARFIKLGGLCHGERVAKYNRLLAIEEELAQRGALGQSPQHQFPVIREEEKDLDPEKTQSKQLS